MSELLTYTNILNDRRNFQRAGTKFGNDFNVLDTPSQKYFKILFYFGSNPEFGDSNESVGLLAPTWEIINEEQNSELKLYNHNSAWAFLKLNDENERAEKLEHFITLLSDISSRSPWYFTSISGVQEALERKVTEDGKLDMNERKKMTISCLPDAFDNRIGTLLELYRDVTWSWTHKREVIPSNLRKFDMAIYIFETPEKHWHTEETQIATPSDSIFNVGYKMIEFHDCEFNYNSVKTAWATIDNQTGFNPTYQIDISYNDCYEISYNDIMMRTIGDVILTDLINFDSNITSYISQAQTDGYKDRNELTNRIDPYKNLEQELVDAEEKAKTMAALGISTTPKGTKRFGNLTSRKGKQSDSIDVEYNVEYEPGFIGNAIGQVAGHATAWVKSKINRAIMGNLFTFSLTQLRDQAKDLLEGNLIKTGMSIAQYVKEANARKDAKNKPKPNGDIFPEPSPRTPLNPHNLYSGNTIANNL